MNRRQYCCVPGCRGSCSNTKYKFFRFPNNPVRGMDVAVRNQLVECIECHSLYHQECHDPPVAEADMKDPRSAWLRNLVTCIPRMMLGSVEAKITDAIRTLLILGGFSLLVVLHGVLLEYLFLGGAREEIYGSKQAENYMEEAENSFAHMIQSERKPFFFPFLTSFSGCMVDLYLYNFCVSQVI